MTEIERIIDDWDKGSILDEARIETLAKAIEQLMDKKFQDILAQTKAEEEVAVIKARKQAYWDGASDNENGYIGKREPKAQLKKGLDKDNRPQNPSPLRELKKGQK